MTVVRNFVAVASLACCAVLVGACSSSEPGTPLPAGAGSAASSTSESDTSNTNVFAGMDSCEIVDAAMQGRGFQQAEKQSERNTCRAKKLRFGSVGLTLDPSQGLDEFAKTDPNATRTTINGRPAMQATGDLRSCIVALEVGKNARALVLVNLVDQDADSCPEAKQLAQAIEPKLPEAQ